MNRTLLIAGMHRSGTSMTANWLQSCGLDIGEVLMKGGFDNEKGHFEDYDFLKIHQEALRTEGLKVTGLNLLNHTGKPKFNNSLFNQALKIVKEKNLRNEQWGWKEPRSTLFLAEWKKIIPEIKVLAIYRPYWSVVDSLIRRTRHSFLYTKKYHWFSRISHISVFPVYILLERKKYLDAWIKYNQAIMSFKEQYPEDIIICSLYDIIQYSEKVLNLLDFRFEFKLNNHSIQKIYNSNLLNEERKAESFFLRRTQNRAEEVLEKLISIDNSDEFRS